MKAIVFVLVAGNAIGSANADEGTVLARALLNIRKSVGSQGSVHKCSIYKGGTKLDDAGIHISIKRNANEILGLLAKHDCVTRSAVTSIVITDTDLTLEGLTNVKTLGSVNSFQSSYWEDKWTSSITALPLTSLYLQSSGVTGRSLKEISTIDTLEVLMLDGNDIHGREMADLTSLKNLRQISISGQKIDDMGMKNLATLPNLAILLVKDANITDKSMMSFADCSKLELLSLAGCRISQDAVDKLKESLPACVILVGD